MVFEERRGTGIIPTLEEWSDTAAFIRQSAFGNRRSFPDNPRMADATHSYFDWQVSTLMLAYDVIDPLPRSDHKRINDRQTKVEQEIQELAQRVIPPAYRDHPEMEFPPAVVMLLTRATIGRAAEVMGVSKSE